jgi:predicted AAA+ superfamily ATPase
MKNKTPSLDSPVKLKIIGVPNAPKQVDQNSNDNEGESQVVDLTGKFKQPSGVTKMYCQQAESHLAMYAVTQMINDFGKIVRNSRAVNGEPTVATINTDVHTVTTVYCDVFATIEIENDGKTIANGIIQAVMLDDGYRVALAGAKKEDILAMERMFNKMLEKHNFFQGKTLRYGIEGVEFVQTPSTTFSDTILPEATMAEYQLNVIEFLTSNKMHAITKKRGMLLYGPPGTGKTSSIKAMFRTLFEKGVTCVFASDASFAKHSVEDVFTFINKYLAPCLVVFEDIDLLAPDRRDNASRIIGPLLSALNGIEEQKKPIVILATTNRVEVLDAAITRPCRFDRRIKVDYPSEKEMAMIFKKIAGFDAPVGCMKSSADTKMTGAHVEEIYRTAALLAEQKQIPIKDCVLEAVETIKKHFMIVGPKIRGFGGDGGRNDGAEEPMPEDSIPSYPGLIQKNDPFNV